MSLWPAALTFGFSFCQKQGPDSSLYHCVTLSAVVGRARKQYSGRHSVSGHSKRDARSLVTPELTPASNISQRSFTCWRRARRGWRCWQGRACWRWCWRRGCCSHCSPRTSCPCFPRQHPEERWRLLAWGDEQCVRCGAQLGSFTSG